MNSNFVHFKHSHPWKVCSPRYISILPDWSHQRPAKFLIRTQLCKNTAKYLKNNNFFPFNDTLKIERKKMIKIYIYIKCVKIFQQIAQANTCRKLSLWLFCRGSSGQGLKIDSWGPLNGPLAQPLEGLLGQFELFLLGLQGQTARDDKVGGGPLLLKHGSGSSPIYRNYVHICTNPKVNLRSVRGKWQ